MSDAPDSFGAWCFVAAAFCVFIPETAGRSLEVRSTLHFSQYQALIKYPVGHGRCLRRHE